MTTTPAPVEALRFQYRNHRGEVAVRRVQECSMRFGSSEWYPEPQWLMRAFDIDKSDYREFAVKNILSFGALTASPATDDIGRLVERLRTGHTLRDSRGNVERIESPEIQQEAATALLSQQSEINRLRHDIERSVAASAELATESHALIEALSEVMAWISNWDPNFTQDDEWPATAAKARAALPKAST